VEKGNETKRVNTEGLTRRMKERNDVREEEKGG